MAGEGESYVSQAEADAYFEAHDYDQPEEPDDELAEAEMNCGRYAGGGCSLAGTEYCDWDCPFS